MATNLVSTTEFASLYDAHVSGVYNFIFYRTGHRQIAEDLTAQIFLKALERLSDYNSEISSFKTWVYTIARNTVIDHYRTSKSVSPLDEAEGVAAISNPELDTDRRFAFAQAGKLMAGLSPEERELVTMRVWDELSYAEISAVLGKSEAAAKMMFSRTMSKLRESAAAVIVLLIIMSERINL